MRGEDWADITRMLERMSVELERAKRPLADIADMNASFERARRGLLNSGISDSLKQARQVLINSGINDSFEQARRVLQTSGISAYLEQVLHSLPSSGISASFEQARHSLASSGINAYEQFHRDLERAQRDLYRAGWGIRGNVHQRGHPQSAPDDAQASSPATTPASFPATPLAPYAHPSPPVPFWETPLWEKVLIFLYLARRYLNTEWGRQFVVGVLSIVVGGLILEGIRRTFLGD